MLGEPMPNEEKQPDIDFDTMEEFEFVFDIALAPEFKAEVSARTRWTTIQSKYLMKWWKTRLRLILNVMVNTKR